MVDFEFTPKDFAFIRSFIKGKTGIDLSEAKYSMVYARLVRRLRQLQFTTFAEYCELVQRDEKEQVHFINQITTNVTSFFREKHHFDKLIERLIPIWQKQGIQTVKIWSAGCSSGQEPYTIAMVMQQHAFPRLSFEILATDLDSDILHKAEQGIYPIGVADEIPEDFLRRYFKKGTGENAGFFRVLDDLRSKVTFSQLNFQEKWEYEQVFHAIFCRNVMIYFDHETQERLVKKFYQALKIPGFLFLGHSENIMRFQTGFELFDKTIYQKGDYAQ